MIKFTDTTFVLETEEEDGIPHRPLKIGKYRLYQIIITFTHVQPLFWNFTSPCWSTPAGLAVRNNNEIVSGPGCRIVILSTV